MSAEPTARRWTSRVDPLEIRQLYESDAWGMLDMRRAELQAAIERVAPDCLAGPKE